MSNHQKIAIHCTDANRLYYAQCLALELNLPYFSSDKENYDYLLLITPHYLGLQKTSCPKTPPFFIDFLAKKLLYRVEQASLRKELLARAIGLHPSDKPYMIDATAGIGRDSFVLASLGFSITMLEKSPIIYVLLRDAIERAQKHEKVASIIKNLHLHHADAIQWLPQHQADLVYLDPMFPVKKKSSSSKKEMTFLNNLLLKDDNVSTLFKASQACARYRIVVKRPRLAENITPTKPHFSLMGRSSRFDIYLNGRNPYEV